VADDWSKTKLNLNIFGVTRSDPGWLYLMKQGDLFKIGMTKNPPRRIRDARTWLPNVEVIAMKPFWNVGELERMLHEGLANYWHEGEWFKFPDADSSDYLVDGFKEFYEKDRDTNSVDFIYWYNSSGMMEFRTERDHRRQSLRKFQRSLRNE
jgi:hypothetical protein